MPYAIARLLPLCLVLTSPVVLSAQSDAPAPTSRELRRLGPLLSMDWVADGKLQSPDDMLAAAGELLRAWPEDPQLRRAVLHYAAIAPVYRTGLLLYRGRPATSDDIPELARAFVAGLTDDEEAKADTIATVLRALVVTNAKIRAGSELIAAAAREHASIWSSLAGIVASGAGPATAASPLGVAVVLGDGRTTGLQFRNEGAQTLHGVVLGVDSTLATADQGNVCTHTIFVPTWAPQRTVLLPPRLMLGAARGGGGTVTYRVWAAELSCAEQLVSLASSGARVSDVSGGEPVVLSLGGEKAVAGAPAPDVPAADDAGLAEATALLERSSLKEAQEAFEVIEAQLSKRAGADGSLPATLAVARYRLAEVMRRSGFAAARAAANDDGAKKILLRAKRKYGEVLGAPDTGTQREGRSLHAAALRHLVHIDAILCQGYRLLAKQRPREKSLLRAAEAHEASAKRFLKTLEVDHPNVHGADGRTHVEAAKAAVREVMQSR